MVDPRPHAEGLLHGWDGVERLDDLGDLDIAREDTRVQHVECMAALTISVSRPEYLPLSVDAILCRFRPRRSATGERVGGNVVLLDRIVPLQAFATTARGPAHRFSRHSS